MLERLPTPWGLVRLGVAPDHPKIKSVSRVREDRRAARLPLPRQRRWARASTTPRTCGATRRSRLRVRRADPAAGSGHSRRGPYPVRSPLRSSSPGTAATDYRHVPFTTSPASAPSASREQAPSRSTWPGCSLDRRNSPGRTRRTRQIAVAPALNSVAQIPDGAGGEARRKAAFTTPELQELGELAGADVAIDGAEPREARPGEGGEALAVGRNAARTPDTPSRSCRACRVRRALGGVAHDGTSAALASSRRSPSWASDRVAAVRDRPGTRSSRR